MTSVTKNYRERDDVAYDPWGTAISYVFSLGTYLYAYRNQDPADLELPRSRETYQAEPCEYGAFFCDDECDACRVSDEYYGPDLDYFHHTSTEQLNQEYRVISRYADVLKAAGRSY